MSLKFDERHIGRLALSSKALAVTAGATDTELVAAPGAGKRIRVYGAVITQQGTAAADANIKTSGGKVILQAIVGNTGVPVVAPLNGQFIEAGDNESLTYTLEDQDSDDAQFVVYYTIESN